MVVFSGITNNPMHEYQEQCQISIWWHLPMGWTRNWVGGDKLWDGGKNTLIWSICHLNDWCICDAASIPTGCGIELVFMVHWPKKQSCFEVLPRVHSVRLFDQCCTGSLCKIRQAISHFSYGNWCISGLVIIVQRPHLVKGAYIALVKHNGFEKVLEMVIPLDLPNWINMLNGFLTEGSAGGNLHEKQDIVE